jgi:hypothetical protein
MRASLCVQTLDNARKSYSGIKGCIIHSDRGSQYTSTEYRETIKKYGIIQSMNSAGGRCHDGIGWVGLSIKANAVVPFSVSTANADTYLTFHRQTENVCLCEKLLLLRFQGAGMLFFSNSLLYQKNDGRHFFCVYHHYTTSPFG